MSGFSAVVTTGIYCRPGCHARPSRQNVTSYPLAASAEAAGYRACLHCRPHRWPHTISWSSPELVCRGVRLILDGALDGATEEQLGARLGVSSRHLRRLFTEHLGVTPDGLARSARAHFARRLLDDTDLSMLQIARAAGFGSVRQFNRACQEIFHASPRVLRAKRRKTDRLVADGGLPLRLAFRGQLDWEAMVAYFEERAIPGVEMVERGVYRRTIVVDGDPGVLELHPGKDDHLVLVAHLPHWDGLIHLAARVRRIANLDFDPDEPAAHLAGDRTIGPLVGARPGLRTPGAWGPFEAGVRAIVRQHASNGAANRVLGRIAEGLGDPVAGLAQLRLTHTFPGPAAVASGDLEDLGLPPARQETIRSFARAVRDQSVRIDGSVPLDELIAALGAIRGLGCWAAHDLALRIGEPDALPVTDLGLRRLLALPARPSPAAFERAAAPWRPWRAIAAFHLWRAGAEQHAPLARPHAA